jgi:hypothetical protein
MNLNNLRKAQLHGARIHTDSHIAIASVSRAYGFGRPPSWEENDQFTPETAAKLDPAAREFVDDPLNLAASRTMLALPSLDHTTHQILNDARLSPAGRAEKLRAPRIEAIKTIGAAAAAVAAHGQALKAREAQFYAPPTLPANDVHVGLEDHEVRARWRTMPISARTAALERMARGEDDRLLEALARSPVRSLDDPNEVSMINTAWRAAASRRNPKAAAELQAARANHDWADSVVKAAAQYSARSTALTPAEITEAARGTGGEAIFFDGMRDHAA